MLFFFNCVFLHSHCNVAYQDSLLDALRQKVEDVYRTCIGDSQANLSTLQMLTAIERRLGELLDGLEMIPADRLIMAEKAKEKERRKKSDQFYSIYSLVKVNKLCIITLQNNILFLCSCRRREEQIDQQKQHQEERIKKSLERAQAEIKKTVKLNLVNLQFSSIHIDKLNMINEKLLRFY